MDDSSETERLWSGAAALAWSALFVALALVPDEKYSRLKLYALQGGLLALTAAWACRVAARSLDAVVRTPLDLAVLGYGASGLLFFLLSPEPRGSEPELARVLLSCGAFFAASQAAAARPRWIARAWTGSAALAALYACCQRLGSVGPLVFPQLERPFSTFGNPIFLACYLGATIPATAALLAESAGAEAGLLLAALGLQAAGLWVSQSRAGFAALLAGACLWILLRLSGRKRRQVLVALASGAAGLVVLFLGRARAWTHPLIWRDTLALWRAHPWLGCGLGRFHIEFPAYASQATRALWPEGRAIVNFAHNEYLQVLAETGVVGLAAFAAVPAAFAAALLRRPAPADALEEMPALAAAGLFGCAFFSPDMRFGVSSFLAFASLGFWAARAGGVPASLLAPRRRAAAAAAAAVFTLGLARLAIPTALAQRRLARAPAFHVDLTPELRAQARSLEALAAEQPRNADVAETLGYLYARAQAFEAAAQWFARAARLAPERPGPWNNLGNLAYMGGDAEAAIGNWERSLKAKPDQLDAHLNLAKLYFEKGRLKEASAHCEKALALDPGNDKARVLLRRMVD